MIKMSQFTIDYKGTQIWSDNKRFVAKERAPVHFEKSDVTKYRQLGNVLVHKTSGGTGYITKLAFNK